MFKVSKLKALQEQCLADKTSFKAALKAAFTPGDKTQEADKADLFNISFQDVAEQFLGRNEYKDVVTGTRWEQVGALQQVQETGGGVVLGSAFQNISGFTDVVAGLVDAMILQSYLEQPRIAKELAGTKQVKVNGGKRIKATGDGKSGKGLAWGEPLPNVGLSEMWVNLPVQVRYGNRVEVDQSVFIFDFTGQVQEYAVEAGTQVAFDVETDGAKVIMGITNPYKANDTTGNTFLTTNGAGIMAYTNAKAATQLLDYTSMNTIQQILEGNTDPFTSRPISVRSPTVLAMPQNYLYARSIIRAIEIQQQKGTTVSTDFPNRIMRSENPLADGGYSLVQAPRNWYNLLNTSLSSATNAQGRWYLGDFKRAFEWLYTIPFSTKGVPLSSEDISKGTVLIQQCEEAGVMAVIEPRYVGYGSVE